MTIFTLKKKRNVKLVKQKDTPDLIFTKFSGPILSMIGSILHKLAKWLAELF